MYFVADPAQPLDGNLRATTIRIPSSKTAGEFDASRPFIASCTWGGGNFHIVCKMVSLDSVGVGKQHSSVEDMSQILKQHSSVEDMSQIFEKLKVSPGAGLLSDGPFSICVGKSDVSPDNPQNR